MYIDNAIYFNEDCIAKDKFSNAISWLRDTGILEKVKYDVMNPPIPIPDPIVRHNQPLIIRQLGIIMIILVVGLAIATIVFFVELCIRSKSGKTHQSRGGIEIKERVERHANIIKPPAAPSGPTPVITM